MTTRRRAFTLIELLTVVSILVLLMVIFAYAVIAVEERGQIVKCTANLRQLHNAVTMYALNNQGSYPMAPASNSDTGGMGTGYYGIHNTYMGPYSVSQLSTLVFDGNYLSDWRVLFCPNQEYSLYYKDINGTVQGIIRQFNSPTRPHPTTAACDIGYSYANGNSPGWIFDDGNNSYQANNYRGKNVMINPYPASNPTNPHWYSGGGTYDANWNNNSWFAAGYMCDPPNKIIYADVTHCDNTTRNWDYYANAAEERPLMSHKAGMNTLYNDGRVLFSPISGQSTTDSKIWYNFGSVPNQRVVYGFR